MERREFLVGAATAAGLAGMRRLHARTAAQDTLDRIAIMTLNFHALLKLPGQPDSPERTLEVFDLPEMIADTYGVHNLEFQHYHLPATEASYFRDLRAVVERARSRVSQLVMEFGPLNISAPDHNFLPRLQAIDLTKVWIDRAAILGCPRVMVNQGQPSEENKHHAIETLRAMGDYGRSKGVMVSMETRGGSAARQAAEEARAAGAPPPPPPWVLLNEITQAAGTYTNIDLGGIGAASQDELHTAIRALLPTTHGSLHTRTSGTWDLPTAVRFIESLGYTQLYSIEVRGHEGTKAIRDTLLATL